MQRQLFFEGSTQGVAWRETPLPRLENDDDVLVRPLVVARCDLDRPYLFDRLPDLLELGLRSTMVDPAVLEHFGPHPFAPPFAVGHEFVAEVSKVGPAVTTLVPGDRVIASFQISCGRCSNCLHGTTANCGTVEQSSVFGFGPSGGGFGGAICDLMRIPFGNHMLLPVPAALPSKTAVAAGDNLCVAWQAVVPELRQRPGARVLVLGGGCPSIGLYAVGLAARHSQAYVDYVDVDRDEDAASRLALAERLGARRALSASRFRSAAAYDLCVDASGSGELLAQGLRALRHGGVCNNVALQFSLGATLPITPMYLRGVTLRCGWGDPRQAMTELLATLADESFDPCDVHLPSAAWSDAAEAWMQPYGKVIVEREPMLSP